MSINLSQYINESIITEAKYNNKILDMEEITYPDGTVVNVKKMLDRWSMAMLLLHSKYPFVSPSMDALVPIYTHSVKTMATDGYRIFVNPHFMETELSDTGLIFVIMHELMHCILNHIPRSIARNDDHKRSNIAGDYEINGLLVQDGLASESVVKGIGALLDSKYYGWPYEQIYEDNPKGSSNDSNSGNSEGEPGEQSDDQQDGGGSGNQGEQSDDQQDGGGSGSGSDDQQDGGSGCGGNQDSSAAKKAQESEVASGGAFIDPKEGEKIAKESGYDKDEIGESGSATDLTNKWRNIAQSAAGKIGSGKGGNILNAVLNIYKPSKNWKSELKRYIGNAISKDEEEKMGRKTVLHNDQIKNYDRQMENSLSKVLFMIDTSGSVSDKQLVKMLSECQHICRQKKVPEVTFAYYDYGIGSTETLKYNKKPDVKKVSGGGGTSFRKACDDIQKMFRKRFELVMVFTDGDTIEEVPTKPKNMKNVVFVVIDRPATEAPKYGKTVYIKSDDVE